jgi:DNA sulfur modification protein DndD
MILDEITLHNFGIYLGEHRIDLRPRGSKRPIVLIGALNGSGKTTLLDALQLVLYGKFAECSNRRELSYEEFLRRSIHRKVDASDGAAIELRFRHHVEGVEQAYRVRRTWAAGGKTVRERLDVSRNGNADPSLAERWPELVEEFIPSRLARFFFFDGEKIESLADLDRSTDVLATAIRSLLGLDIVEQLDADLRVVERRNRDREQPDEEKAKASALDAKLEELDRLIARITERVGSANNELTTQQKVVARAQKRFDDAGGSLAAQRGIVEAQRKEVESQLERSHERLQGVAEGDSPLLLVRNLVERLAARGLSNGSAEVASLLTARDEQAISFIASNGGSAALANALRAFFEADRASRRSDDAPTYVSRGARLASHLHDERLTVIEREVGEHISEALFVKERLDTIEATLAASPDDEAIADVQRQLSAARSELATREAAVKLLVEEEGALRTERDRVVEQAKRVRERIVDGEFRTKETQLVLKQSERVRELLATFRGQLVERHVQRLESLILESFKHLLRKEALVDSIRIDPASYQLSLIGSNGEPVSPERLSAGERQLLAVSIIWGMFRAAGRPLPVVIDTPLGRLDSVHRKHLVERYFPTASHQVILLSTDEEIDQEQYHRLEPHIGRAYTLSYDHAKSSTQVHEGYFAEGLR